MTRNLFEYDCNFNVEFLAGVDEAGRGPLAGPVVTACCSMPLDKMIDGVNDSKKLSEKKYCKQTINFNRRKKNVNKR